MKCMTRWTTMPWLIVACFGAALCLTLVSVGGPAGHAQAETVGAAATPAAAEALTPGADAVSAAASGTVAASGDRAIAADVFIWDTTSQGIGALRALQMARPALTPDAGPVQLVIASTASQPSAMPAQGLAVEDIFTYHGDTLVSGFWAEFRRGVVADYRARGINALNSQGRLVTEPEVAARQLRWYIDRGGAGRPGTTYLCAHLLSARYRAGVGEITLRTSDGATILVTAKVLIDASVEGDLALMLGARYRFGLSEKVYGPATGPPPVPNGDIKETWIQRVATLLTLKIYPSAAPRVAGFNHAAYDSSKYDPNMRLDPRNVAAFATSWTMQHPLPNNKREFNESWSDCVLDIAMPYTYVFGYRADPQTRLRIRNQVLQWTIDRVRYLQEHGYPNIGLASVPSRIYLREGPRVVGKTTYTADDVQHGRARESVAFGMYAEYDVHLPIAQKLDNAFVRIPMGSLISADIPGLLIPGPISTDHVAYNSAVRMEPLRANAGGAAGVMAAVALARGISPDKVSYTQVSAELRRQGYRLGL